MNETKVTPYKYIHNRGSFFSEYFLGQLMQKEFKGKLGESTRKNVYRKLRNIYQRVSERLSKNSSPADTWNSWSFRLFEELGWPPTLERAEEILADKDEVITNIHWFKADGKSLVIFKLLQFDTDLDNFEKGRKNTPHKVLERAVASSNSKWGIIFNGNILRLVRSESYSLGDSYLEIDIEGIFEADSEEEFYLFYALFRKEAFVEAEEESLLTKISEQSKNYATRVNESLRDSVFHALETLLKGIVADHHNKHFNFKEDLHTLYEEGLVFLYRLLFILYGESRDLLPRGERIYRENYSVEKLRDEVDDTKLQFHPNRYYLWESLSALFRLISKGVSSPDLYVTAYNGRLFNDKKLKYLPNCKVNDEVMKKIVILLSRTEGNKHHGTERIAYNELGVDQLGSVYEGLLEYEPKLAEEDLVVIYVEKELRTVPKKNVEKEKIVEEIVKGSFYLSLWGGRRKGSGSYYTPSTLTKFLVKQAIDPIIEGKKSHELLSIKIVDPAMGSGAFLVAAAQYLSKKYTEKFIGEGNIDLDEIDSDESKKIVNEHGRLIAEHCIYGVDLNPMAVELAKVSLWLATLSEGKPLSFLDHRLRCGNSLIGASLNNLELIPDEALPKELQKENKEYHKILESYKKGQLTLAEAMEYSHHLIAPLRHRIDFQKPEDTVEDVKKKEELLENDWREGSSLNKLKKVCDLWCSTWFWSEDSELKAPSSKIFRELKKYILHGKSEMPHEKIITYLEISSNIARDQRFFHWEVEFPEIFLDEQGQQLENRGFTVALGNPPWDKVKPFKKEFFGRYNSKISIEKKKDNDELINQLLEIKNIKIEWENYSNNFNYQSNFYKYSNFYIYQGMGEFNTYKLFCEKFYQIIKKEGTSSIILPSSIHSDLGTKELRKLLLEKTRIISLLCFDNERKIFQGVMHSVKFDFITFSKQNTKSSSFRAAFVNWKSIEEINDIYNNSLIYDSKLISIFSPDSLSFIESNNQYELNVINKIYSKGIYLKNAGFKFTQELHMTNDKYLFNKIKDGKILYEGKMINQYIDDFSEPTYWVSENKLKEISQKYYEDYRIAIRSVASEKDERTFMATILPKSVHSNSIVSMIINNKKNYELYLFTIGLFNSLIFDRILKYKVNMNLNLFHLEQMPFISPEKNEKISAEIIKRSLKLMLKNKIFSDLGKKLDYIKINDLNDDEQILKNQIDALVAILYDLSYEEFDSILNTFKKGSYFEKYSKIKEDVLIEYDNFKKKFGFSEAKEI